MKIACVLRLAVVIAIAALVGGNAVAAETNVAVAANFTDAAKEIAAAFKQKTGHEAVLSFGSSGQFYTQITQDAPFQIMLSADEERPKKLVEDGLGVADSRFTYAIGKLVLWSKTPDYVKGEETLKAGVLQQALDCEPRGGPLWRGRRRDIEGAQDSTRRCSQKSSRATTSRRLFSSSIPATPSSASSPYRSSPAIRAGRAGWCRRRSIRRSGRTPCC